MVLLNVEAGTIGADLESTLTSRLFILGPLVIHGGIDEPVKQGAARVPGRVR